MAVVVFRLQNKA